MNPLTFIQFGIFFSILHEFSFQDISKRTMYIGQAAKLICGPPRDKFFNIKVSYKWEKPLGNVISTEPELLIPDVKLNDGGIYTCRITQVLNERVSEQTISTELAVQSRDSDNEPTVPPIFVDPPIIRFKNINEGIVDIQETDFLYTACEVSNWQSSDFTVRWWFNQAPINGANSILFVSPLDADKNAGYYTCRINHKLYPQRTYEKQLLVNVKKPEISVTSFPEESLKIGGRIYRKCEMLGSKITRNEALQFSWKKDNSFEIATGSILDIPIRDTSVNGDYSCVVNSEKLNKKYSKELTIRIDSNVPINPSQQKINIFSQPTSPELNKEFQLKCEIFPRIPNANYIWRKDNNVISSQQTLIIPSFQRQDIGSYSCEIVSSNGDISSSSRQTSDNVNVKFQYSSTNKIELDESGAQMISRIGEKREMHCEIATSSSNRGRDVEWFFNKKKLDDYMMQQYNILKSDRNFVSIISLTKITPKNEGLYTCRVDNMDKKANLIVIQEEASLTINPERIIRKEGDPVEFHCRGNSIPEFINTRVKWSFKSRDGTIVISPLENENRWEISNSPETPETSFISISSSLYKDDGFYTCTTPEGFQKTAELIIKKREDTTLLTITPEIVRVRNGQPVVVECFSVSGKTGEPYGEPKFTMEYGRSLSTDPRLVEQKVGRSRIRLSIKDGLQTGDNNLKVECHAGIQTKSATIFLENQCPQNYRRCNNGECQPSGKFCDGVANCADGSDENPSVCNRCDPLIIKCEIYGNKAPLKDIFLIHWKCDGENDCGNYFDESQCGENDYKCGNIKFNCSNGKVIPRAYQCDKESDCLNGEDEIGCILPQVTSTTEEKIRRIRRGGSTELRCESYGVPRPQIVWRYNWGCLGDSSRMTIRTKIEDCNRVISILRIINFQPGDDGIYNCEILSGQNRSFSDDYQLILDNN